MGNSETKITSYGYRIIKVAPGSPAMKAGLIEFLDYIVDISSPADQTPFSENYTDFFKIVQNSEDIEATLTVYNILHRSIRTVTIIPSKKWENSDSLLGALVRYEEYATAHERVLRIATVHPQSPASAAGLQPEHDYILGSPQYLYTDLNELANFIEMTQEKETIKSLELYLYSSQTNSVRSTLIIPNKNWGGAGHLGCEFALGILNHLPHIEEKMFISHLGENWHPTPHEHIERLDDDDTHDDKSKHPLSGTQQRVASPVITTGQGGIVKEKVEEEKVPESKLRPPTDAEIDQNRSHPPTTKDMDAKSPVPSPGHELTSQKMKLLHLEHQHKVGVKSVAKPFIKSGKSLANPFHDPKQALHPEGENEQSILSSFTQNGSTEASALDQSHEKVVSLDQVKGGETEKKTPVKEISHKIPPPTHVTPPIHVNKENSPAIKTSQDAIKHEVVEEIKESISPKKESVQNVQDRLPGSERGSKTDLQESPTKVKGEVNELNLEDKSGSEKQVCKTTFEYNFFSKKLSGDYKIKSTYLFNIDELSLVQ